MSGKTAVIISFRVGVAMAIFISPTWTKLLELGQYGYFFIFLIVVPLLCAILFYIILRVLGWGVSLLSR